MRKVQLSSHSEEAADRHDYVVGLVVLPQNKVVNASDLLIAIIVNRRANQLAGTDIATVGQNHVAL